MSKSMQYDRYRFYYFYFCSSFLLLNGQNRMSLIEQKTFMKRCLLQKPGEGETWYNLLRIQNIISLLSTKLIRYIISLSWFRDWKTYVMYEAEYLDRRSDSVILNKQNFYLFEVYSSIPGAPVYASRPNQQQNHYD